MNDREPTPLYHQMAAAVSSFDAKGYTADCVGPEKFVATLPKER